ALLPLNPYLLGTLLGDGGFTGKAISLAGSLKDAADTEALVMATVPAGIEMRRRPDVGGAVSWGLTSGAPKPNPVMSVLRALDLQGRSCYAKFIPEPYMRASVGDRIALLQGLLDTDGTVAGSTSFWSTSHVMALQVEELVRSLGGNARCRRTRPNAWRVRISRLPAWIVPFRLPRKVAAYTGGLAPRSPRHTYLVKAEYVGRKPVQCIKVDAADHLYLTDDFVVTHNTVNMVVTLDPEIDPDAFKQWIEIFRTQHEGVMNAYRTLYLAGGAAVTPVGNNFQQMEFAVTQKAGEIRIASAAGVPAIVAGLGGGLEAGTHENFQQARRQMGDMTLRPLWRNACGSLQAIVPPPGGSRLWYDDRDIAFLREDRKDLADIQAVEASAISSLITAGFQPESAVMAIRTNDFSKLVHSGMYSVQLQPPNTLATPIPGLGTGDKGVAKAPAGTVPLTTGQLHPPAAKNGKAPKAS
ncbi:MAG: phage portal protein, partial [Candidatus Dormibacteria bacterium]